MILLPKPHLVGLVLLVLGAGAPGSAAAQLGGGGTILPPAEGDFLDILGVEVSRPTSIDAADYDGDGNLDLLIAQGTDAGPRTTVFRFVEETINVSPDPRDANQVILTRFATFTPATHPTDLLQAWLGTVTWADYDGDGVKDVLVTGARAAEAPFQPALRLYRTRGGAFVIDSQAAAALPAVYNSAAAWADADGDGDLDLALAGRTADGLTAGIYRNETAAGSTTFVRAAALVGVASGSLAWGDYDGDGDPDLALTGNADVGPVSRIYRNDGGAFVDLGAGLIGLTAGGAAWGDYDGDGDLDLLLAGGDYAPSLLQGVTRVYRNDGGVFNPVSYDLPGLLSESVRWGDYDGDGDLDILLVGPDALMGTVHARVYENTGDAFEGREVVGNLSFGKVLWFDYECDRDLDVITLGEHEGTPRLYLFRNGPTTDGRFIPTTPRLTRMACPAL